MNSVEPKPLGTGETANGLELNLVAPPRILPAPLVNEDCFITELEFVKSLTEPSIKEALL